MRCSDDSGGYRTGIEPRKRGKRGKNEIINQSCHGRDSFTKQESVPSTSNSLRLTLCQNADGSFPADTTTATILGLDLHKLIETGKPEDPVVWATILCLLYLEENCRAERESWELVAEKAIKWLDCRGVGMGGTLEQRARHLIREG